MSAEQPGATPTAARRGPMQSLSPVVVFDVVGPLVAYYSLRAAGLSTVAALILSGLFPAFGIALSIVSKRRLDAIGMLVLIGIVVGTTLGLVSGSPRLVLVDGTVPTAVFGFVCLGSLWSRRPLIYRFALQTMGDDTAKGRDFADRWRYPGFRHAFRVATVVWGLAFVAEAAAQVVIIETSSTSTAKTTSNVMPVVVAAAVITWNASYAKRGQRKGELALAAAHARGHTPPAMPSYGSDDAEVVVLGSTVSGARNRVTNTAT
ncbi:MAG: DUF3159 domain-containing protein [Actinomycetota bacterium]|nr:DUF3159 domain-containing protein [Actinomycetota bacterium]